MRALVCLATWLVPALAFAAELRIDCPGREEPELDELEARLRLTLRATKHAPDSLIVTCTERDTVLLWDGPPRELLSVEPRGDFSEDILDAVEKRLQQRLEPAPTRPAAEETADPSLLVPPLAPTASPRPTSERVGRDAPVGGLGLALAIESLGFGVGVGPRLDVGVGLGQFALTISESARSAQAPDGSLFQWTIAGGLGWGAPFSDNTFGVAASAGVEWISLSNIRVGTQAKSHGFITLGPRVATRWGGIAGWVGLDAVYRPAAPVFGPPVNLEVPTFTVALTLGAALVVVDSRTSP